MSPEGAPTDQQVLVLEQRRVTASLAADVDELDKLIDDDCCYVHSSGSVDTKKSYLAQLRRGTLRYTRIACSEHAVSVQGFMRRRHLPDGRHSGRRRPAATAADAVHCSMDTGR